LQSVLYRSEEVFEGGTFRCVLTEPIQIVVENPCKEKTATSVDDQLWPWMDGTLGMISHLFIGVESELGGKYAAH
jgi:hypothetical protein